MKLRRGLLYGMALVLLAAKPGISAMESSGTSDRLEWKVVRNLQLPNPPVDVAYSLDGKYIFVLTKKSEVLVYDTPGTLQGTIPVDKGVKSIAIGPRGQFLHLSNAKKKQLSTLAIGYLANINADNSPIKGKKDAPVTVAVYSDFQ
mgnify:CR=1 FL=1